jgi:hypothetical protein
MKRIVESLSYANVVATLALLLVVTGGAALAANQLARNSVGTKQLRRSAVTTIKIKNGAVTPAKIGGSLPGARVDPSTLRIVPNAAQAGDAQTVQGLNPDQIAARSRLRCPDGMVLASGVCFEPTARPPAEWLTAISTCGQAGRRLPDQSELISFEVQAYSEAPPLEWAGGVVFKEGAMYATVLAVSTGAITAELKGILAEAPYRCAVDPLN